MSKAYYLGGPLNGQFIEAPADVMGYLDEIGGRYVRRVMNLDTGHYRLFAAVFLSAECSTTDAEHEAARRAVVRQAAIELCEAVGLTVIQNAGGADEQKTE
jgi:hypothetical protein